MSNFNEYFRNTGAKQIVERFLRNIDTYNKGGNRITKLDYSIEADPGFPASYYTENGLTANFRVGVDYELNNSGELLHTEFEVPKEIDGTFIIEGSYRISVNKLGRDFECRFYMTGSGNKQIVFDYNKIYNIDSQILTIKNIDPNLGITTNSFSFDINDIDNAVNDNLSREALRLTERQSKKLQVKLNLDYYPEFITKGLIEKCMEFGDDRNKDLIVDKTIDSVQTSFMRYLFKDNGAANLYSARKRLRNYYNKYNKLQNPLNPITSTCLKYFKLGSQDLQIPPGVNAVNLESFKSKILINPTVAYNTSMSDLIDIADTPINGNTNLQNSLTVSCHVTDDGIKFDVFDKKFNKVTIDYLDYLNSKVIASESVDYDKKELVPKDGKLQVKYRMNRITIGETDDFDFIDLHPDYRLSSTTRRIPFVNFTDSVRISMGTSMLKQSIDLINAERPLVDTGNYDDLEGNVMNDHYEGTGGEVIEINDDNVIIRNDDTGNTISIPRKTAIKSINNVAVYTEPKVKVGDKVSKGDVILGGIGVEKDTVKSGLNTNVLFHAYHGLVNEDAVVVSESYAKRMAHYSIIDIYVDLKDNAALEWIAPIGTQVKEKDPVVKYYRTINKDATNKLVETKLGISLNLVDEDGNDLTKYIQRSSLIVPNNIDYAVVSDVRIEKNLNPNLRKGSKIDYSFSDRSIPIIEEYNKTKDRKIIYSNYPEYIASDTLDPIIMDNKMPKVVYTVKIRLIEYNPLVIGDKLTSRYGGKGVISKIVPDDKMPIANGKRVEVILNPYSTINRKIPSVIMETAMGNIAIKLYENVQEMRKTEEGKNKIMPMINKYYDNRYDGMSVDEFLKLVDSNPIQEVFSFKVGCFSKYTPQIIDQWMKELNVSTQATVKIPRTDVIDSDALKEVMSPEEFDEFYKSIENEFVEVERPLMFGNMVIEKLYHMPKYSNKVTTDMTDNQGNEPLMGRGRYRKEGQKIGEMELSALLSRNAQDFIKRSREHVYKANNQLFLNNLLALGLRVVDDSGYSMGGSDLKDQMTRMRNKYKIKGNN